MKNNNPFRTYRRVMAGFALAFVALLLIALSGSAQAASAGGIGYYVRANLPGNQIDNTLTYFDLRMQPGDRQTIEVEIVNEADEAITVDIRAISASTNRNGIIDYKTPDIRDKTLLHPFSELARLGTDNVRVPPQSTATVQVHLQMPDAQYDGVILGGLHFTRRPEEAAAGEGMLLQNVYSYVIGVKLSETDVPVLPEFELDSVAAQAVDYAPAILHTLRNRTAAIAKGISVQAVVRNAGGATVATTHLQQVDMAPNSVLELAAAPLADELQPDSGWSNGQLEPGDYTGEVTVTHNGEEFIFTQAFTIGSVEAETANNALPAAPPVKAQQETLLIVLLAGTWLLLLLLALFFLLARRNRRKAEDSRA